MGVFKGIKTNWDKSLAKWQRSNPRKKIPKSSFVELVNNVVSNVPISNIKTSFRCTGIYDIEVGGPNRLLIDETQFRPHDLERYKKSKPSAGTELSSLMNPNPNEPFLATENEHNMVGYQLPPETPSLGSTVAINQPPLEFDHQTSVATETPGPSCNEQRIGSPEVFQEMPSEQTFIPAVAYEITVTTDGEVSQDKNTSFEEIIINMMVQDKAK